MFTYISVIFRLYVYQGCEAPRQARVVGTDLWALPRGLNWLLGYCGIPTLLAVMEMKARNLNWLLGRSGVPMLLEQTGRGKLEVYSQCFFWPSSDSYEGPDLGESRDLEHGGDSEQLLKQSKRRAGPGSPLACGSSNPSVPGGLVLERVLFGAEGPRL